MKNLGSPDATLTANAVPASLSVSASVAGPTEHQCAGCFGFYDIRRKWCPHPWCGVDELVPGEVR